MAKTIANYGEKYRVIKGSVSVSYNGKSNGLFSYPSVSYNSPYQYVDIVCNFGSNAGPGDTYLIDDDADFVITHNIRAYTMASRHPTKTYTTTKQVPYTVYVPAKEYWVEEY